MDNEKTTAGGEREGEREIKREMMTGREREIFERDSGSDGRRHREKERERGSSSMQKVALIHQRLHPPLDVVQVGC